MKCSFKHCQYENTDLETVVHNKKRYHKKCLEEYKELQETASWYQKAYNPNESWKIMMRSLYNWYPIHGSTYMLFCMCKAIRNKRKLVNFHSFYYVLNDLNYKKQWEHHLNPEQKLMFGNVILTENEHILLLREMHNNSTKLKWYIKQLDNYINQTGKQYSSHFETLKLWYAKENAKKVVPYKETFY